MKLEVTKNGDSSNCSAIIAKKKYEECIGCKELQDKFRKANDKCAYLELDIGKKNSVIEWLESKSKVGFVDLKKLKVDVEATVLRNEELEKSIRSLNEEHDELMIENKVLEYEKNKAEAEVEIWKAKYKELENEVMELKKRQSAGMMQSDLYLLDMHSGGLQTEPENKVNEDKHASGVAPISTPSKQCFDCEELNGGLLCELKSTVGKCLNFAAPHNSISPATPGGKPPFNPVDISDDSDDDLNTKRRKIWRGVACVVTSESETEDNIPICRLRSTNQLTHSSDTLVKRSSANDSFLRDNPRKRRLRRVRDHADKGDLGECSSKHTGNQNNLGISENLNNTTGADEIDNDSSTEGESLGGFIVNSSESSETDYDSNCNDMSAHDGSSSGDCSGDSENELNSMAYKKVISGFRRERKDKLKWYYEADMLADFAKCPELCMKAVCAVYCQQTAEEKSCKATILRNGRGFNPIHALCGSTLAEFLTDGDPKSDVKKTVKELEEFNSKGVEQCRKLATHYSKQLFDIYQNKENPFFHP